VFLGGSTPKSAILYTFSNEQQFCTRVQTMMIDEIERKSMCQIVLLTDTADTRCVLTTAQSPHHQLGPTRLRQYSVDVRHVNLPRHTYQHYSESQSSCESYTVIRLHDGVYTALHVMQTRYSDENSVRSSVRPSVCHTRGLWQNGKNLSRFLYHTKDNSA